LERLRHPFYTSIPNFVKIGQSVAEISRFFSDFQDGGRRHLGFSKIPNFNGLPAVRGQFASPCQISSKSVKRLPIYGNLTILKMAAVRHLGFVGRLLGPPTMPLGGLYRCAKFG